MGSALDRDIVLLFDYYTKDTERLHISLKKSGYDFPAVVIEEDGFLTDEVDSVYGLFLGDYSKSKESLGRPRYFNEIKVPKYWEISATGVSGKVTNLNKERARIYYREPLHKRLVRMVDWLDENGVARSTDFYNKYGVLYARMAFNKKGEKVTKSYFSFDGKEAIVENFVTGDVIINDGNVVKIFRSKTEIVLYYLDKKGYLGKRLFINSLSTPFFVSQRLSAANGKNDILFWQEGARPDVPGNMQMIFDGQGTRIEKVLVQKKAAYDNLLKNGANPEMTNKLGFVYSFARENSHGKEALICTNSDNIAKLTELVTGLPDMKFHITAITEMSAKLQSFSKYDNVRLYPGIDVDDCDELFTKCDYYFDINYENEIVDALTKAFMHKLAIVAFKETLHNDIFVTDRNIYSTDDYQQMISKVKELMENDDKMDALIEEQCLYALSEKEEAYKRVIG